MAAGIITFLVSRSSAPFIEHNILVTPRIWCPLQIALDVARGLVFLHSRRVVHFDLKSPNILLAR
jgi:hypothetical protein